MIKGLGVFSGCFFGVNGMKLRAWWYMGMRPGQIGGGGLYIAALSTAFLVI